MAEQFSGEVWILDNASNITIKLDGNSADVLMGGSGRDGDLALTDAAGVKRIHIDGQRGNIRIRNEAGEDIAQIGGEEGGNISLRRKTGDGPPGEVLHFDSRQGALYVGGTGAYGNVIVRDIRRNDLLTFSSTTGVLAIGTKGHSGNIIIRDSQGRHSFHLDGAGELKVGGLGRIRVTDSRGREVFLFDAPSASLSVGGDGNAGDIFIRDHSGRNRIHLDGNRGDIELTGGDCAEEFEVSELSQGEAGMVLVIEDEGRLSPCSKAYDKRVAGVVSGAGSSHPGVILGKDGHKNKRVPLALVGRVHCKVDAQQSPIEVGDLLTTSPTRGHAMKAQDHTKAFGAVVGKALRPLENGKGLIPIIIALQ